MERPRRSIVKRNAAVNVEIAEVNGKRRKKEPEPVKKPTKNAPQKDSNSDSESSSDEFVRMKSEPGPLKLKEETKIEPDFAAIESSIFDGVMRLSDSESDSDFEEVKPDTRTLSVVLDRVKVEPVEADSVSDPKNSSQKKLQLSKLRKSAVNGLNLKEEKKDKIDGKSVKKEKIENEEQSKTDFEKASGSKPDGKTTRAKKPVSAVSKDTDVSSTKEPARAQRSKKTSSVAKTVQNKDSDDAPLVEKTSEKNQRMKAKPEKGTRGKKESEAESSKSNKAKAKEKKSDKATSKSKVSSTSTKNEPGTSSNKIPDDIDNLDMNELLALGENLGVKAISQVGNSSDSDGSDVQNDDWEEVDTEITEEKQHIIPKEGVQITLEMPELFRRRQKKKEDMQAVLNRQLNRVRKEFQILFHKVSVLCWLAHGFHVNKTLNDQELLAVALSVVPSNQCLPPAKVDMKYVQQITAWFVKLIDYSEGFTHIDDDHSQPVKREALERQFSRRIAKSKRDLAFMFICILRAVGMDARLVISLQPMSLKPQSSELFSINSSKGRPPKKERTQSPKKEISLSPKKEISQSPKKEISLSPKKGTSNKEIHISPKELKSESSSSKPIAKTAHKPAPKRKSEDPPIGSPSPRKTRSGATRKSYKEKSADSDSEADAKSSTQKKGNQKSSKKSEEPLLSPKKKSLTEEETEKLRKLAEKRIPTVRRRAVAVKKTEDEDFVPKQSKSDSESDGSDSDFTLESRKKSKIAKVSPEPQVKKEIKGRKSAGPSTSKQSSASSTTKKPSKGLKVLSSSEDEKQSKKPKKLGTDYWVEVYVHKEESWVPVDVTRGKVDCASEIKARATQPITYVVAWNRNNTIKDVTRRYVSQFSQVTAKQRVDEKWWNKTMKPYKPKSTAMEREEEGQLHMAQLNRPMPTSVAECKNHPLYVLKRHLLKFEAIYPADAPTLGFVKSEALYARQNVYTLHSREIWIKEAKVVRLGEKPYKIVKARPKYDRSTGNVITDLPLELFGPWQVEDYDPPAAVDGKVPRNAYGNVELFKPTMLPKGCVHLQLPSLNRVARKLQIDCAPAVVGFDYHCGGSHPTYDGFVVCEEHVDILVDAWNKEIEESEKRQKERDEKRIYGNWKRLIKGLLIREHLNFRYDFKEDDPENEPADTRRNEIAAAEARLHQPTAKIHSVFPTLMAKMRSGRGRKSTGPSTSGTRRPSTTNKPKAKGKTGGRRKKKDTSSEEEETDFESSSSEDEDDVKMVLLSDEDSGSEFEHADDDDDDGKEDE